MDRIIEVNVGGNHLSKDNKNAGVRGEANVTKLRITFDESWDSFAKKVTFWDAHGANPVERTLTTDLIENIADDTRKYIVPIPAEPMAEAGTLTFVIDGYIEGKRQRSMSDKLEVKDAPIADNAGEPSDPTPTQAEQLQAQIDTVVGDMQKVVNGVGKTSYIGDNGNWYEWDSEAGAFYDTGIKAQAGSTVYCGGNPPPEAEVWVNPDGDSPTCAPYIGENGNWYAWSAETQTLTDTGVKSEGKDGYTPQRGVDYWTEEEKAEISTYVEGQVGETEDAVSKILEIQEKLINGTSIIELLGAAAEDHTHTTEQISGLSGFAKIETGSYEGAWDGSSDLTTVELTFGFEPKLLLVGHEYGFMLAMAPCSYPSFSWLPEANPPHDVSEIEWDGKNIRWCSGYSGFNQMGQTYYYVAIG